MNTIAIIIAVISEMVAVFVIVRLWIQQRMSLIPRILVSILFLIPFVFMVWFAYFECIGGKTILSKEHKK